MPRLRGAWRLGKVPRYYFSVWFALGYWRKCHRERRRAGWSATGSYWLLVAAGYLGRASTDVLARLHATAKL